MNTEKYVVRLTYEERQKLETLVKKLKATSQTVNRAIVLLKADGPNWTNVKNPRTDRVTLQTISNIRKQLVLEGFDAILDRKKTTVAACSEKTRRASGSTSHCDPLRFAARGLWTNGRCDDSPIKSWCWKSPIPSVMK
jgi:hypothetical protein